MTHVTLALPTACNSAAPRPLPLGGRNPRGDRVGVNARFLTFNGRPWLPVMGEFHYARYPADQWDDEVCKIKAGGVEIMATYTFWIHHEEDEGVFDWSGRRNLRRFVRLCGKHGLWVMMRIGPFCHGEARNGGLPDWLYGRCFPLRCNDPRYLAYVRRLYGEIGRQVKGLMFKDGGPVIGLQVENEFMDSAAPWETTQLPGMAYTTKGAGGLAHLMTLRRLARAAGIDTPLHTCTGWGASPIDVQNFLPMFGGYGYQPWMSPGTEVPTEFHLFRDKPNRASPKFDPRATPYACCEIGGGMQAFYKNRPVVPPESVEAMHVGQLGSGSNLMGYYVYHGGRNPPGKHGFLNQHDCPRISYDFQAPLSEFGRARPHYGMLRRQFLFLRAFGDRLAPMTVAITRESANCQPTDTKTVRWAVRARDKAGFVFTNNFQDHLKLPDRQSVVFRVRTAADEVLTLPPSGRGLTLPEGVSAILPFNFDLDGVRLRSASVQPITRIEHDGAAHYFFFAPRGFPAEYAFDSATFTELRTRRASARSSGRLTLVEARPGTGCLLRFTLPSGKNVCVTTLTDEQSRQFWQARMGGRDRVFLSDSQLLFCPDAVDLRKVGDTALRVAVYPGLAAKDAGTADGIFTRHTIRARRKRVAVSVRRMANGKAVVRIPRDALRGVHEVYLQIDYVGDTASAYLDGRLVHDHFWDGRPWEIALRPFAPRILETELVLVLTPARVGGGANVEYSGMAAMRAVTGAGEMAIRAVRAVVEYSARVQSGQGAARLAR